MRKMMSVLLLLCMLLVLNSFAGEIYTYTDKNGRTVISNTPIPDEYKAKAKKIDAYSDSSGYESKEQGNTAERKRHKYSSNSPRYTSHENNSRTQVVNTEKCKGDCDFTFNDCKGKCSWKKGHDNTYCMRICMSDNNQCMNRCSRPQYSTQDSGTGKCKDDCDFTFNDCKGKCSWKKGYDNTYCMDNCMSYNRQCINRCSR